MVKLTFLGGARTVTGSSYLLTVDDKKIIVDCGLFQGRRELRLRNYRNPMVNPAEVDYIFLTHAHIDHSGLIPRFYKQGFKGKILATKATVDLCAVMLPDAGHIQEVETEFENRKAQRRGEALLEPLYTAGDAQESLALFEGIDYGQIVTINESLRVRFIDAGHILGSAILEVWAKANGSEIKIVFSGDLGKKNTPIIRDPSYVQEADYLLVESTYGDRSHEEILGQKEKLKEIINTTLKNNGNVVIPAFAVERTQEILYALNELLVNNEIPQVPVYVDSPLAVSATEIFKKNKEYYDEDMLDLLKHGDRPFDFPGTVYVRDPEESRKINETPGGKIIISASGMADAGRIKHHLKHNLWRKECAIVFVGYQAEGTLGRRIVEGEKKVRVLGELVHVAAKIYSLQGFSAHADREGLMDWIKHFERKPQTIFIVHGEEKSANNFSVLLKETFDVNTVIPDMGEEYALHTVGMELARPEYQIPYETDVAKRALLAIVHLEKKLADIKEDLILTGGNIDNIKAFEDIIGSLEEKVGTFERLYIRK